MRELTILLLVFSMISSCNEREVSSEVTSSFYPPQLEFGDYGVGFQTLWLYDNTREAIPYSDWNGRLSATTETEGRQFQINIWYPAEAGDPGDRINMEHYLNLSYQQINFDASEASMKFGRDEFRNKMVDLGGVDSLSVQDYAMLAALPCLATENAAPIGGALPLILYPSGMAPASNSTTAEFLASHGYAVAGFAAMGKDASTIDASAQGITAAVEDIAFVLRELLKLPFIDEDKIGLIGNAIESSFCAAYLSKNSKIKSYVSLEGGFLSDFEQSLLEELPYYEPEHFGVPLLLIYSPHPSIDPTYIEKLKYTDRYFAHLPGMREFDYLNFGLLDSLVPGIIGETRGDVRQGYTSAHNIILKYFDAVFDQETESFKTAFKDLSDPAVDTTFIWPSNPVLPPLVRIKDGYIRQGLPYLDSIYKHQKQYIEIPFTRSFMTDFINWVSWKKDPGYTTRKWLMEIAVEDYPESSLYTYNLARYALRTGDSLLAKSKFREALEKLPNDPDETLTKEEKIIIRTNSQKELKILN